VGGSITACPAPTGLTPSLRTPHRAVRILAGLGRRSLPYDLHHTDRAWWPGMKRSWRAGRPGNAALGDLHRLFAGPLRDAPRFGVPQRYAVVRERCGAKVANGSAAVITGPRGSGGLQELYLFLSRHGHVLLYNAYP
jgi:hypothetical protein